MRRIALVSAMLAMASVFVVLSPGASAAEPGYQMPFPCGESWQASTYDGHSRGNYALDFNRLDDHGDTVIASAAGEVVVAADTPNAYTGRHVVISHSGGFTTYYGHLENISVSVGPIEQGDIIGAVGNSGYDSNTGQALQSHLHYEQRDNGGALAIKFDGQAAPYDGSLIVSKNCTGTGGTDTQDASPSLVVGNAGTVHSLHVATDRCAKIYRRVLGTGGFATPITFPSTNCGWSLEGTADMAIVPGQNYQAWMALVRIGADDCHPLYLYKLIDGAASQVGQVGQTCGWSSQAPPSITVAPNGTVYIAAVRSDGTLFVISRTAAGLWTNEGPIGSEEGDWSETGSVSIEASPDGTVWLAALKADGRLWTFQRELNGNWTNRGMLGAGDWSPNAQPGLAVDSNGHVTVAAVETADADGAQMLSYRRCATCSKWHEAGQIGSATQWSDRGTLAMAAAPDGKVWLAAVKTGNTSGAELYTAAFTPNPTESHLGTWSGTEQRGANPDWSPHAAPAITVAGGGTVFMSAVKQNGQLWTFRRDAASGAWTNYGQVGGSGWAGTG